MPINRVECPECGAGLKSAAGFKAGQTIACPKCETYFQVPAAAEEKAPSAAKTSTLAKTTTLAKTKQLGKAGEGKPTAKTAPLTTDLAKKTGKVAAAKAAPAADEDDDEDRPKKKKKKKRKDDEDGGWSYSKSWVRVAVLGVLLIVLGVLGFMLYKKNQADKETAKSNESRKNEDDDIGKPISQDQVRASVEKANRDKAKNAPKVNPIPQPAKLPTDQAGLKALLTGTWVAKQGNVTHTLEYKDDGTFSYTAAKPGEDSTTVEGEWSVDKVINEPGAPPGLYIRREFSGDNGGMQKEKLPAQFMTRTKLVKHSVPGRELDVQFDFEKKKS